MYVVLRFLLAITHFLYIVYYFLQQKCIGLVLAIQKCKYLNENKCRYSIVELRNHLLATSKLPRHLAILLGQEELSVTDLVRLISWCTIAEIPYLSLYDHKGIIRKSETAIRNKLHELEPFITESIEWTDSPSNGTDNGLCKNELNQNKTYSICTKIIDNDAAEAFKKHKTKIKIFSYADGKDKIVSLTKHLAKIVRLNIIQDNDITQEFLDKELSEHVKMPDPDIAIVFGKTMCNYGFMPWQTRVTEFFVIPSHHNISSSSFIKTLIKFSECQQRYGK